MNAFKNVKATVNHLYAVRVEKKAQRAAKKARDEKFHRMLQSGIIIIADLSV